MYRIYSVEDDRDLQDLLRYSLSGFGYDVTLFDDAESLFDALSQGRLPDLILLDIMLPKMDGIEALSRLKSTSAFMDIPVIMLTAKGSETNIVHGLNMGADDYMSKPFSVVELSARINAQLRKLSAKKQVESGGIFIDVASHEAKANGNLLALTAKEFELLYMLVKNSGKVQKRDDLLNEIWGYEYLGETRTLDMHIRTLRAKLGGCADCIVTVRGIGYKYCPQEVAR